MEMVFKSTLSLNSNYFCEGANFYNKKNLLESIKLFCELTDQIEIKLYYMGKKVILEVNTVLS